VLLQDLPRPPVGVGIDGQMHGIVVGSGADALRPAILWPDSRAVTELERWRALPEDLRAPLANPLAPGMFGPLLGWLARHEPDVLVRAEYACSPKDWLRQQFAAGPMVTDPSDASATLAWHLPDGRWHLDLLHALGMPAGLLPRVAASSGAVATTGGHLPRGLPMSVGCADTAATLLATDLQPGEVLVNVGTGIQVCMLTTEARATGEPRCHTYVTADGGWYSMVAPQNGGLALGKVRELLAADWTELYASLDHRPRPGSQAAFLPWFSPDRLPTLRAGDAAGWRGLGLGSTRADLLRASLEAIAFQVADAVRALPERPVSLRFTGGGTRDPRMRQLLCDVVGLPARNSTVADATVLGAALLGFQAAGLDPRWPTPRSEDVIEPRRDPALDERRRRFSDAVNQQLDL
jgi:xylulokinase